MTDITPSDPQSDAIRAIIAWYKSLEFEETGRIMTDEDGEEYYQINRMLKPECEQVFYVAGYAGTGKTTITKYAIQELGLDDKDVKYGAYTGKAALVMRRSGTPAKTIHSLIYAVHQATDLEIEEAEKRLSDLELEVFKLSSGLARAEALTQCSILRQEIKKMKEPHFGVNPESEVLGCKLIVLDECSMIGDEMAADLLSFRKPILVLGDPGQLPPIRGEGSFTKRTPDVFLTEIHRQAAESPIIHMATLARNGQHIPYGAYGSDVAKMHKHQVDPEMIFNATQDGGQVICGLNSTRFDLNNIFRRTAGFDPTNPIPDEGSKIICLRNRNDIGLINGMFIELHEICPDEENVLGINCKIKTEDGDWIKGVTQDTAKVFSIYRGHFEDHVHFDQDRQDRDWKDKRGLIEATFGWAITCHKAQGSAFDPTVVWDDHMSRRKEDRRRWLYTAITRAVSKLLILD